MKEKFCKGCNKLLSGRGKSDYCRKCNWKFNNPMHNKSSIDKMRKTNLEKYGSEWQISSKEIRSKIENTCLQRYGTKCTLTCDEQKEKAKKTKKLKYGNETFVNPEKTKQTCLERYGVDNPAKSEIIKKKSQQTCLKKYGVEFSFQSENNVSKRRLSMIEKYGVEYSLQNKDLLDKMKQSKVDHWNSLSSEERRFFKTTSKSEKEIFQFIKSFFPDAIENYRNKNFKEVDIYIPSKNFAIEYNGSYWHSFPRKSDDYHLQKTLKCQYEGIQLFHIWEWEWLNQRNLIKSMLKAKLGIFDEIYEARKLNYKIIEWPQCIKFLDENHLQKHGKKSNFNIGLYNNDSLLGLLTFGKSPRKNYDWELLRLCFKQNCKIIGGSQRLWAHKPEGKIYTFCDFSKSNGFIYKFLGMKELKSLKPSYIFTKNSLHFNQQAIRKRGFSLLTGIEEPKYVSNEYLFLKHGWNKIFNCGNLCFEFI
jgi:hypothetical protein